MDNWIYLKSNNPADALALSTVLASTDKRFYLVRRSNISMFFVGLDNVVVDFYSSSFGGEILNIDEIDEISWIEKCNKIASFLDVELDGNYSPYCGFIEPNNIIIDRIGQRSNALLYLFPTVDQVVDLMILDSLVRLAKQQGVGVISGGTTLLPNIRGTLDLRQIVDVSVLCSILPNLLYVVTTEEFVVTLGEAFNVKVFLLTQGDGLFINGERMNNANQILNYISIEINRYNYGK